MGKGASLTQSAYETIRADILACRIPPGARANIVDVAARLEVSPGAVREALSRLTAEGLVIAEPQRGFRAAEVSVSDLRDLTSTRVEIERLCALRSVANGDLAWESRLVAIHHELSRLPEREPADASRLSDAWSAAHGSFHEALVGACDSRYLLDIRRTLYARAERYRRLSVPLAKRTRVIGREHEEMLEAALARKSERLAAILKAHLERTTAVLVEALTRQRLPG